MTDITPAVNALLEARSAPTIVSKPYSIPQLDEFLKEAYNIVRDAHYIQFLRLTAPANPHQ